MTNLFNILLFFSTLVFWLVVFFWFIRSQRFSRKALVVFSIVAIVIIAGTIGASIYARYQTTHNAGNTLASYMGDYVFRTGVERLGTHWLASIGFSALATLLFVWLWRAKRGLVIDGADVTLLSLGMLMVQWPGMLIMLLMVFVLVLLLQVFLIAIKKRAVNDRLIITPAIPVAVILTLLFGGYLAAVTGLSVIRF